MSDKLIGLIVIALWVAAVYSCCMFVRIDRGALLEAARRQFRSVHFLSSTPSLELIGETAEVMKEEETGNTPKNRESDYVLTVYARNEFGEYFMFRSGSPNPFVKHMEHRIAKVLLKGAYVAPDV
jgi:hypothetical protein